MPCVSTMIDKFDICNGMLEDSVMCAFTGLGGARFRKKAPSSHNRKSFRAFREHSGHEAPEIVLAETMFFFTLAPGINCNTTSYHVVIS